MWYTLGPDQKKYMETQNLPYLLQFVHSPHQFGGNWVQLQEIQAIESSFQHVYDGGELWDKGRCQSKAGADTSRGRCFFLFI